MSNIVVAVGTSSTVASITRLRNDLGAAIAAHADIALDLAETCELDLSFLQLVEATRRCCSEEGKSLRLLQPAGPALAELLDRAGFIAAASADDIAFWFHGEQPQ
jgi:hypothetical protein